MEKSDAPRLSLNSIGSLFCDTWKLYKERAAVLLEIVLLPTLITILGYVLRDMSLGGPAFLILGGVMVCAGFIILTFSVLPVIFSIHHGTGVDESYRATVRWFWPFIWLTVLELLVILGASMMLIIPGIWLAFALSLMAYTFVIEHRRGVDALRQSKDYIKGYWWPVTGRILLLGILLLVVTIVVQVPVTLLAGRAAGNLVSVVLSLFFIPFSAIYHYTIFQNLRERKPHLATAQTKSGTGFITASAVVGIVIPTIIIILAIFGLATVLYTLGSEGYHLPPPGYGTPYH